MRKKNKMTKAFLLILTFLLIFSMSVPVFAFENEPDAIPPVVPEEERISISDAAVYPPESAIYTGSYIIWDPAVIYRGTLLKKWADYQLFHHNNCYPGTATIEIRGVGKFKGKKFTSFEIFPATCDHLRVMKTTSKSVTVRWYYKFCDGYLLYKYNYSTGEWEMIKKLEGKFNREYTLKNLTPGSTAKIMVKSYVMHKGETITGKSSEILYAPVKPAKSKIKSVTAKGNSTIVVKWPKQRCSGYVVEVSEDKAFTKGLQEFIVKASEQVQKTIPVTDPTKYYIDKGYGKHYVRVRAFKRAQNTGRTVYGSWSEAVTVNVKK